MNDVVLAGCRAEPLGSYLKALGVLRLVGEQKDSAAKGLWEGDSFWLITALSSEDVVSFFLDEYRPTPLLAPWNSGSGFRRGGKRPGPERTLEAIESSTDPRLRPHREAIAAGRLAVEEGQRRGWRGEEFWDKKVKSQLVELCRATFPDDALRWLDASVVLAEEPEFRVSPLLGTGGNLGSQELSISFMQRLIEVLLLHSGRNRRTRETSSTWLRSSLFGGDVPWVRGTVGQFDAGAAGGVNSAPAGAAEALVNPWDFVLLLEGAALFAGAAARRLGAGLRGRATMPFMFDTSPVGYASAAESEASQGAELWAPTWSRAVTVRELSQLIGEGRVEWQGRQAGSGLDAAKAVAALGVDRGIDGFVRYVFVKRFGQSMLSIPAGRITVTEQQEIFVLGALDRWAASVRRGTNPPATVSSALRRMDSATFAVATRGDAGRLQEVLIAVADLEEAVGRAPVFRSKSRLWPIGGLRASDWLPVVDDGSSEFRVAAALASQHEEPDDSVKSHVSLRTILRPVAYSARSRRWEWTEGPAPVTGLGIASLPEVLASALAWRSVRAGAGQVEGGPTTGEPPSTGVTTAFRSRLAAPLQDVALFVHGLLDEDRVSRLLAGLLLLDWTDRVDTAAWWRDRSPDHPIADTAWALLAPFFHCRSIRLDESRSIQLRPLASWASQLSAGRVEPVLRQALVRLRMARIDPALRERDAADVVRNSATGPRLAAALLCPVSGPAVTSLLHRVAAEPVT